MIRLSLLAMVVVLAGACATEGGDPAMDTMDTTDVDTMPPSTP